MHEIVVIGGYGHLGSYCVAEFVRGTRARVVVVGRNIQRAEQVAAAWSDRARAAYGNLADPRTLERLIPEAAAVVLCGGEDPTVALDVAIRARVPIVSLIPCMLDERRGSELPQAAWEAQVPIVLNAGAVPGLAGVLADSFTRRFDSIHKIRIASTGPWLGTDLARQSSRSPGGGGAWRPSRWQFPDPIGGRWVRPATAADLVEFEKTHCVKRVTYLEPDRGALSRGFKQIFSRKGSQSFAIAAEAVLKKRERGARPRMLLEAPDVLAAASASAGVIVSRILRGRMPGGFFNPHEVVAPQAYFDALEKRGIRTTWISEREEL